VSAGWESLRTDKLKHLSSAELLPPYDLTSDMMLGIALCHAESLRSAFSGVPFLSFFGRTPLVVWFSRVKQGCGLDPDGRAVRVGNRSAALYNEMTVIALLRARAVFVPGIYATSRLTIEIGYRYGMPKQPTTMALHNRGRRFWSDVMDEEHHSFIRARQIGRGSLVGRAISRLLPLWSWPARFPGGGQVKALIRSVPRVQVSYVREGRLDVRAGWLSAPISFLPVGIYLPDQQMRLPDV
jgi:hypothetical protein